MLPTWTDDTVRAHHHSASPYREQLNQRDQTLLEAYGPAMQVPPDIGESAHRLQAAHARLPSDWLITYALADTLLKLNELPSTIQLLDELLRNDPSLILAWAEKGLAYAILGEIDNARSAFDQCLTLSPYAESCLEVLVKLDANEGNCVDSERRARALMSLPQPRDWSASRLAAAIYGRGGTLESVHDALKQAAQLAPKARREIVRMQSETQFAILSGDFAAAQRFTRSWEALVRESRYEDDHTKLAELEFQIAMELGQPALAARLASERLAKRDAWLASTYFDWEIVPLRIQYLGGGITRPEFERRQEAWLLREESRPRFVELNGQRWMDAYALSVKTREDALDALRAMPKYLPFPTAFNRDVQLDGSLGRTYLVAGQPVEALPHLRRGARACTAIRMPFEHTWATLHLGMALEQTDERAAACAAYSTVLARWGREPRSVSARTARIRSATLNCAISSDNAPRP